MKGFLISAPNSGAGKTVITLALMRALKNMGVMVVPAKAGPDFIDPAFHHAATDCESYNLDCYAMRQELLSALSARLTKGAKTLVVEGMMGLYDGAANGQGSSAELAKTLGIPVLLVIDCASQSHSVAAIVKGFIQHMPSLHIAGVILNKVGSARHEYMLRQASQCVAIPILGVVYRNDALKLKRRHLGLVQASELLEIEDFIEKAANIIKNQVDLEKIVKISLLGQNYEQAAAVPRLAPLGQNIAIAYDDAFRFAYPHILAGWRQQGAEISTFSPLKDEAPKLGVDAVYLCGGYPELFAEQLANAEKFKKTMHKLAAKNVTIYGECGGYMTLGETMEDANGKTHKMLGLLPLKTSFLKRKLHLGYRHMTHIGKSFKSGFFNQGAMRGHEFHYASIIEEPNTIGVAEALFDVHDALSMHFGKVGLQIKNIAGSFIHVIDKEK